MKLAVDVEESDKRLIVREYRKLLRSASMQDPEDRKQVRKAFDIATEAHSGVRRKSGEPYILHPIAVAQICVSEIGLGPTSIVGALLHDVVEDTSMTIDDIEHLFGEKVAGIIDGLTKVEDLFDQPESLQAENFRKVLLTLADDVRVILIKLADRLHNMRTLGSMRKDKQLKIAAETLYIYAPLAHRLGLYNIKSELEDLSLSFKTPSLYHEIQSKLKKTKAVRTRFINRFTMPIKRELDKLGLSYEIKSRTKSIYSIYSKMRNKNIPFEEVYDVFAIRIIVDSPFDTEKTDCWKVYSIVTDFYQPNPDRLRDWISTPKANGYESLHTTVMSPTGKWVEVQIRSLRMDEIAEKGYAAHWKYKEQTHQESALDAWVGRIRELLENPETDAVDFVDDFKLNLFAKEIFAFTPKGDIKSLPHRATVLDFAYEIHTQLGHHCVGAKVNNRLVPASHQLESGDQVQIIRSKAQKPEAKWLETVTTAKAKSAIKTFLRSERKKVATQGDKILKEVFASLGITEREENIRILRGIFKLKSKTDLLFKIGSGEINRVSLEKLRVSKGKITYKAQKTNALKTLEEIVEATRGKKDALVIGNQTKLDYKLATCCNPIPGDDVMGFVTKDGSIYIHRINCPKTVPIMSNYGYRVVKAKWDSKESITFLAGLKLSGFDRTGLVNEITKVISAEMDVAMRSIAFESTDGLFEGTIMVYVTDTQHLKNLKEKISKIEGIMAVHRVE
jgi:GTP pyrophosphokinase